jgi:hypothetical protein
VARNGWWARNTMMALASVVGVGAPAAWAQPQPMVPQPVVVVVQPGAVFQTAAEVRAAISRELGVPAVAPADATVAQNPHGTLTVASDAENRLVIAFRDATGNELWRTVTRPADPAAALATVAFIAGNLARKESDEVLRALQPPVPVAPPPLPPPAQPVAQAAAPSPREPASGNRRGRPTAIYAAGGYGWMGIYGTVNPVGGPFGLVGAEIHRWGSLSLAAEGGYARAHGREVNAGVVLGSGSEFSVDRTVTVAERAWGALRVLGRWPVRSFRFEAGGGLVLALMKTARTVQSTHINDGAQSSLQQWTVEGIFIGADAAAGISLPLTDQFTLFLRANVQVGLGPVQRGSINLQFSTFPTGGGSVIGVGLEAFGGLSAGCQWNFL